MQQKPIELPEFPKEKEFEEYISSYFQAGGYYIEKNIIDRGPKEVLELDIIATKYNKNTAPDVLLIEIKSGEWGFNDIFKVRGWMDYLEIFKGVFIVLKPKDNIDFFREKAKKLNIDLIWIDNYKKTQEALAKYINVIEDKRDSWTWQYAYWLERNLLNRLNHKKKCHKNIAIYSTIDDYYFEINNRIFLMENIPQKYFKLFHLYYEHPRISLELAYALKDIPFFDKKDKLPVDIFKETYYSCEYNDIQISTFIEYRTRLLLLKSVVDCELYGNDSDKTTALFEFEGVREEIPLESILPLPFCSGVQCLISEHKYFHLYPVFWQWFLWAMGGFILLDYEEQEYKILAQKTGIPVSEVPKALEAFQILFPIKDGWFITPNNLNIKFLKMFSVPFRGIGAFYRRMQYAPNSKTIDDIENLGLNEKNELKKWKNLSSKVFLSSDN